MIIACGTRDGPNSPEYRSYCFSHKIHPICENDGIYQAGVEAAPTWKGESCQISLIDGDTYHNSSLLAYYVEADSDQIQQLKTSKALVPDDEIAPVVYIELSNKPTRRVIEFSHSVVYLLQFEFELSEKQFVQLLDARKCLENHPSKGELRLS